MNWYQLEIERVKSELDTSENGLTKDEAEKRLESHGPNRLAEEEKIGVLKIFLHQFTSPLIFILVIAATVTAMLQVYKDTGVIVAVLLLNAIIGFIQEYKAEQQVQALKKMVVPKARVLRDGEEIEVTSEDIVPGDIVYLASGHKVPADLRLFAAKELKCDESMLTGESIPVDKTTSVIKESNLTPGDQINMAFMGTVVVNGRGKGIVVETGASTVLGGIAEDVKEVRMLKAPLQKKIDRFAQAIGVIVLVAAVLLFLVGILVGENTRDMFMTAVAAAVATVPEGLPIVVTVALSIGVARMAARNAIIRRLPAVETLGSTTVICSDKTGTLTKNEMTVRRVYDGKAVYEVTGSGYEPEGEILKDGKPINRETERYLLNVLRIGLLCNESHVYIDEGRYRIDGDPTEGALLVSAMKLGLHPEEEGKKYPQIAMVPFESERGYMTTLHEKDGKRWIFVKGAPEKLMDLCTKCRTGVWETIPGVADEFAREGLRVLAMAYKEAPSDKNELNHHDLETDLVFAGMQGMMDPPRPEAIEAVKGCKKAGIRVVMITGDHAVTAEAIALKLGIISEEPGESAAGRIRKMGDKDLFQLAKEVFAVVAKRSGIAGEIPAMKSDRNVETMTDAELFDLAKEVVAAMAERGSDRVVAGNVLTGKRIEAMTDAALFNLVEDVSVFARVSPHHKLRITQQLLEHEEIVAVTGDGVNDAPALKAAHIGISMGMTGTDVAKEASDMVIADDNFASIYRAVELGRIVFDNIRKVTFFLIPTGIAAIISILGTVILGLPLPYLPAQLLWINLVTNGLQDVALAFEPGEKDVLERSPRDPNEGIITRLLIERILFVGGLITIGVVYEFIHALNSGESLEKARTIAVTTMVFFQFFQAWNSRSELQSLFSMNPLGNPFLFYGTLAALGAHLAAIYTPFLQWIFRMEPIDPAEWVRIGLMSLSVILLVEVDKLLRRRKILAAR